MSEDLNTKKLSIVQMDLKTKQNTGASSDEVVCFFFICGKNVFFFPQKLVFNEN